MSCIFQIDDTILSISCWVNWAKILSAESSDKCRPIVHPAQGFIGVKNRWFKVFQGSISEIQQRKSNLLFVIVICRVASKIEVAEEDEVVEFVGVSAIKGVRFFGLSLVYGTAFPVLEFTDHKHNGISQIWNGCFRK